jgi:hypothetical protein
VQRHVGNANEDGTATRGWFIGHFIPPAIGGIRSTSDFETKWCVCHAGERRTTPAASTASGTTLVILVSGRLRLIFNDGEALLSHPADYAIWSGEGTHSWIAESDSTVITFRTPPVLEARTSPDTVGIRPVR